MGTPACGGGEPAYQFRALSYVTAHPFLRHLWAREVALNDIGPGLRGVLGEPCPLIVCPSHDGGDD